MSIAIGVLALIFALLDFILLFIPPASKHGYQGIEIALFLIAAAICFR